MVCSLMWLQAHSQSTVGKGVKHHPVPTRFNLQAAPLAVQNQKLTAPKEIRKHGNFTKAT